MSADGRSYDQSKRIAVYCEKRLGDTTVHDLIIRVTDVGICSNRQILGALQEWRKPRYEDFRRRNVWALFNALTDTLKEGSLSELPKIDR